MHAITGKAVDIKFNASSKGITTQDTAKIKTHNTTGNNNTNNIVFILLCFIC